MVDLWLSDGTIEEGIPFRKDCLKYKEANFLSESMWHQRGLRGGSRTAATSKVELFVIIVNGFKPLTIIIKNSTLDFAAVLDLAPLGLQV